MLTRALNNKKVLLYAVAVLTTAAIVMAFGLMMAAGAGAGEVSAQSSTNTVLVEPMKIKADEEFAKRLFACRVDDINDTASIVELFEEMDLEAVTGEYTVEIAETEGVQILSLTVKKPVQQSDRKVFDDNMKKCAQQMLALMPEIGKVQWTYEVYSAEEEEESASVSIDDAAAEDSLGKRPEKYGKSAVEVLKLLEIQSGKKK